MIDAATLVGLAVGAMFLSTMRAPTVQPAKMDKPKGWPMPDFKLSDHFTFWELTNTTHKDAVENNRQEAVSYQTALRELATKLLEPIRAHYGTAVLVSSGFRGPTLNKLVGGAGTSQHMVGQAVDINVKGQTPDKVFQWVWKKSKLAWGQLILENMGGGQWVHISTGTKKEVLTYKNGTYTKLA